jgi:hypothetical protein
MADPVDQASFATLVQRFSALVDQWRGIVSRVLVQEVPGAGPVVLTDAAHGGNLSAIRRVNVAIGNVDDDPITAADLRYQFGVTKGAYSILRPELCWRDVDRAIPALVDTKVALVDDEYGFGTAAVQDDPDQQAFLRQIGGVYFLEMTGAERYAIGAAGYFNFAEVTASLMLRRGDDDTDFRVLFTNPRNVAASTTSNYRWGMTVTGGQSFTAVINSSNNTASTTKATVGADKVLSMQSKIRLYDSESTLFYLDPPYWGSEKDYGRDAFERADFERLADILAGIAGSFILSINDTEGARKVFAQFDIETVETTWTIGTNSDAGSKRVTELIVSAGRPPSAQATFL